MVFIKGSKYRFSYAPADKKQGVHPYRLMLYLGMLASSTLFLVVLIAYTATDAQYATSDFNVPKPFILGSFFILFSSFSLAPSVECYGREDLKTLRKSLGITLVLAMAFTVCQVLGWQEMLPRWSDLGSSRSATYLYILSALHGAHYLLGIGALTWLALQWHNRRHDNVQILVAITNPFEKLKLQLLSVYWHFLGIVWIAVFLYFLFFIY